MIKIEELLKQKFFSELTEKERLFVLKKMSEIDYKNEQKIVFGVEKIKDNQTNLMPNSALKVELLAKMRAKSNKNRILPMVYRIAASLLFCSFILIYFFKKNTIKNTALIAKNEFKMDITNDKKGLILNDLNTPKIELKAINKNKIKQLNPIKLNTKKETEETALLMSFNRKNPNLEWQNEDEDNVIFDNKKLECKAN